MNNKDLIKAVSMLEKEKGVDAEVLYETIEMAIVLGIKKKQTSDYKNESQESDHYENIEAELNRDTGDIKVYLLKDIVAEVQDELNQISLEEALKIDKTALIGGVIKEEMHVDTKDMGRMVAQTAKQIITQKVREVERNNLFDQFVKKEREVVSGVITRISPAGKVEVKDKKGNIITHKEVFDVFLAIGNGEFILHPEEQIDNEEYHIGERLKVYIVGVKKTTKNPVVIISRRHKELIKRLFEMEVPEIHDGTIAIKDIAREAGSRTKISVYSNRAEVDPIGSCIGPRGGRITNILKDLDGGGDRGEKIDIILYSENPEEYIKNALAPATVLEILVNPDKKESKILVKDDVFSLAIGKDGQNVRLAAKLTGFKIDILSTAKVSSLKDESFGGDEDIENQEKTS